jgi:hypothetical protein
MSIRVKGFKPKSGYCIGLKRCIDFVLSYPKKKPYFELINDIYSKDGTNAFEIIFKNTNEYAEKSKEHYRVPFFNQGFNTIPSIDMRLKAHRVIINHLHYNDETKEFIDNEILKMNLNFKYVSICFRGNDRIIEEGGNPNKEDFLNVIDSMKPNKLFVMTDDHEFLRELNSRYDTFFVEKNKVKDSNKALHKELTTQEEVIDNLRTMFLEIEIVKRSTMMISNTSNIYDYISFCNPNLIRLTL